MVSSWVKEMSSLQRLASLPLWQVETVNLLDEIGDVVKLKYSKRQTVAPDANKSHHKTRLYKA